MKIKVKGTLILLLVMFILPFFYLNVKAKDIDKPNYTEVCRVNGRNHVAQNASLEKFAFYKGGKVYNSSCYTCACGEKIYWTSINSTNYYWYDGEWNKHYIEGLPNFFGI